MKRIFIFTILIFLIPAILYANGPGEICFSYADSAKATYIVNRFCNRYDYSTQKECVFIDSNTGECLEYESKLRFFKRLTREYWIGIVRADVGILGAIQGRENALSAIGADTNDINIE